jgi:phosphatidylglycerophosphatase A
MRWSADPRILKDPVHFFAFGFGAGLLPKAPGTAGTLVAVPIVILIAAWGWQVHAVIAASAVLGGIPLCGASARRLGVHDHPGIVWDEIAGYLITMLAVPVTWQWLASGFLLFRFFDIVKPWPIREADHSLGGGLGIMLDDVIAGLFAGAILFAMHHYWPMS